MTVKQLQSKFVGTHRNERKTEMYGREHTLEGIANEMGSNPDTILPMLTKENGFFKHGFFWTYNPLGAWLYSEYAKIELQLSLGEA